MNTSVSAYTHLESLQLFQCLHAYGVAPSVFGRISDLLKKDTNITGHKHYQAGRLSPDALRNFYLERLRKEIDLEQGGDSEGHNGDVAPSTKRKRPSPSLPTVQESLQHQHLIPKLVTKLYASYRTEVTEQIRAEEDNYEKLQRQVKSIERGEWDDQLRERANGKTPASRSPTLPRKSPHLAQKPLQPSAAPQPVQNGAQGGPVSAPTPGATQEPTSEPLKPPAPQNGQTSPPSRKKQPSADPRRTPATPQPLPAPKQPQPNQALPPVQPPSLVYQQPPPLSGSVHNGSPYPNISPYPHGPSPLTPQSIPPQLSPHPDPARPSQSQSQSPVVGPPAPHFQHQPIQAYGGNGVPRYGPPSGAPLQYPPTHQRFPNQQPSGPQSPGPQPPHLQQRVQHPHPGPPSHISLQPHMGQPPPQAGFMLPPFQVSPQDPARVYIAPTAPPLYPHVSTPSNNRQQSRANVQTPSTSRPSVPPAHPQVIQARQSFSTPIRSPLSAMVTPVSARSFWKRQSFNGSPGTPASPRPQVEPLDDVPSIVRINQSPPKAKAQRKSRARGKGKEKEPGRETEGKEVEEEVASQANLGLDSVTQNEPEEEPVFEPETRSGRSRRKAPTKRIRRGSIASSRAGGSVRDRSRSQSILSHTETIAADNESQAGLRIKSERGNSVDAIEEESVATPSHMSTRRRGAAAQNLNPLSTRRKRNAREASLEEHEDQFSTPGPLKTILAQRHFSRMCNPIMNDIQSHKHASLFNTGVRAKDADGYYNIIKRPTDLKTITKAITAGAKLVAAAASDTPAASPGGAGGVVELPVTLDHTPPKAIVNAAQLEKELMRMFVNATMFNPGEDGVVEDAREMFETVQQSVSNWRNVERSSGRTEVEDTPVAEDEEVVQPAKRRKM